MLKKTKTYINKYYYYFKLKKKNTIESLQKLMFIKYTWQVNHKSVFIILSSSLSSPAIFIGIQSWMFVYRKLTTLEAVNSLSKKIGFSLSYLR